MKIEEAARQRAIKRVCEQVGLDEPSATSVVDAFLEGAVDRAFELVNGVSSVPTAMTTARADELRFTCRRAGRLLSEREVEVLFRIPGRTAKSTLTTMMATYADELRDYFLSRMREDATVLRTGTDEEGLTWTLRFSETQTFDIAWAEIRRLGYASSAEVNTSQRKITLPRTITDTPVLASLGVQELLAEGHG